VCVDSRWGILRIGHLIGGRRVPPRVAPHLIDLPLELAAQLGLFGDRVVLVKRRAGIFLLLMNLVLLDVPVQSKFVRVVVPKYLVLLGLVHVWPHHFKFSHDFHRLSYIQAQWLERLIYEDLALLSDLILRDAVQIGERLMEKGRDILDLLQDLCVVALIYVLHEFLEYLLNIFDFFLVRADDLFFVHQPLLLSLVLPFELSDDILLLLIDFPLKLREAVIDVVQLKFHQSLKLLLHL
jgi:hypothetical protein